MKYIFLILTLFVFSGCLSPKPKITKVIDANTTKEISLFKYISKRDFNTTKKLLDGGITPNLSLKNITAIEYAIRVGDEDIVKLLLDNGANPMQKLDTKKLKNITILALASSKENSKILELLFKYGANNKEVDSYYTFVGAIVKNRIENVKYLISKKFDINATNENNSTLLMLSSFQKSSSKITKLLLKNNIDVNATNIRDKNALHLAIKNDNLQNVKYLLDAGIDVNAIAYKKATPLLLAIINTNNSELVKELLDYGAKIEYNNTSALIIATALDKYNLAQTILKYMKKRPEKYLYVALKEANKKLFNFLLDNDFMIKKLKLSRYRINLFLETKRYEKLKEYFEIYALDTFNIKYMSKKSQKEIVKILDSLYIKNKLSDKQKLNIAISLNSIFEYERAYQWLKDLKMTTPKKIKYECLIGANVATNYIKPCKVYKKELLKSSDYARLSWIELILGNYDNSISSADKSIKENKKNDYTYSNKAHSYLLKGEKKKAYKAYKNYFFKLKNVWSLNSIKKDFEMLEKQYPTKKDLFDKTYQKCLRWDYEALKVDQNI